MTEEGVKLILVGNASVGKTSLVNSFIGGHFDIDVLSTNMASYQRKIVVTSTGEKIRLDIWDTAGQEKFRAMLPIYLRAASIALLCCDAENLDSVDGWAHEVLSASPQCNIFIVLTKVDLIKDDAKRREIMGILYSKAETLRIETVLETSAKDNQGVTTLFQRAADVATTVTTPQITGKPEVSTEKKGKGCC